MSDERTPASMAMDEAIDASMEGRDLFPDGAMFINGDEPCIGRAIAIAAGEGRAVVLCYADGSPPRATARSPGRRVSVSSQRRSSARRLLHP